MPRKRTPTDVLEARGSWRARTRGPGLKGDGKIPRCPRQLSDGAKRIWRRIVPKIAAEVDLCSVDQFALARYCTNMDRWQQDCRYIQEHGADYPKTDAKGNVRWVESVVSKRMDRLADSIRKDEKLFGLTPTHRAGFAKQIGKRPEEPTRGLGRFTNAS